jgi:hypothetical protein
MMQSNMVGGWDVKWRVRFHGIGERDERDVLCILSEEASASGGARGSDQRLLSEISGTAKKRPRKLDR